MLAKGKGSMLRTLIGAAKRLHFSVLNTQKAILIILFVPLTLTMFAETLARYVFGIGFFAIEDFVGYFAVWLYFVGAAVATYEKTQVTAELVEMVLKKPRTLNILRAIVSAISVIVAAIMTQWSYSFVVWSIRMHEKTPVHQIPFVYFQSSLLVGSFLMTVYFLMQMIENIRYARRPTSPS